MKQLTIFLLLFFPQISFSQIGGEAEVYLTGDKIEAQFNGGGIEKFSEFVYGQFDHSSCLFHFRIIDLTIDGSAIQRRRNREV